jgi:hypothetical protein
MEVFLMKKEMIALMVAYLESNWGFEIARASLAVSSTILNVVIWQFEDSLSFDSDYFF